VTAEAPAIVAAIHGEATMSILLRESDVARLATMKMALEVVEVAFKLQADAAARTPPVGDAGSTKASSMS